MKVCVSSEVRLDRAVGQHRNQLVGRANRYGLFFHQMRTRAWSELRWRPLGANFWRYVSEHLRKERKTQCVYQRLRRGKL